MLDYGNIAAENSDNGSCGTLNPVNPHNNDSNLTLTENHNNGTNDISTSCSPDAHVAQGVAFFLQNFFILLRLDN